MGSAENRVLVKINKNTFSGLYLLISPTKSTFFLGKKIVDTSYLYEKNEPTLDRFGGEGCTVSPAGS